MRFKISNINFNLSEEEHDIIPGNVIHTVFMDIINHVWVVDNQDDLIPCLVDEYGWNIKSINYTEIIESENKELISVV